MRSYSVVIPVRDDASGLPSAVAAALRQVPPPERVFLCVGPSTDRTVETAEMLSGGSELVQLIENSHGGIPQALNLGLGEVTTPVVIRVDARTKLPAGYAAQAMRTIGQTGAANVGAVQRPVGAAGTQSAIAAAMTHRLGSGGAAYRKGADLARVDTAFLGAFDVDALRSVGGWDESFARNEDAELNLRLAAAGHEVWLDPELVVEYRPRSTFGGLARQYFDYGWWRQRTARRHRGSLKLRQLAAPVIVLGLATSLLVAVVVPWALLILPVYGATLLIAGLSTRELSPVERLQMAGALATMHLAWGSGFLLSWVRSWFG